jgi:hypothetical protein
MCGAACAGSDEADRRNQRTRWVVRIREKHETRTLCHRAQHGIKIVSEILGGNLNANRTHGLRRKRIYGECMLRVDGLEAGCEKGPRGEARGRRSNRYRVRSDPCERQKRRTSASFNSKPLPSG